MSNGREHAAEMGGYYFDVQRYRGSDKVRLMDHETRGIYREILDEIWITGSVPNDPQAISRLIYTPSKTVLKVWPQIQACLIPSKCNPDRLTSERMESVRKQRNKVRRERAKAGRNGGIKSGKQRRSKREAIASTDGSKTEATSEANAKQTGTILNLNLNHNLNLKREETPPIPPLAHFGEFRHVCLSVEDVLDLQTRLNGSFEPLVAELDRYGETHPVKFRKYKNHKAVLLSWHSRRGKDSGQQRESPAEAKIRRSEEAGQRALAQVAARHGGTLRS